MPKNGLPGRPIVCSKCGHGGGTLVKYDGGYRHEDPNYCMRCMRLNKSEDKGNADQDQVCLREDHQSL